MRDLHARSRSRVIVTNVKAIEVAETAILTCAQIRLCVLEYSTTKFRWHFHNIKLNGGVRVREFYANELRHDDVLWKISFRKGRDRGNKYIKPPHIPETSVRGVYVHVYFYFEFTQTYTTRFHFALSTEIVITTSIGKVLKPTFVPFVKYTFMHEI